MSFYFDSLLTDLGVAVLILTLSVYFYAKYTFGHFTRNNIVQLDNPSFPFGNSKEFLLKQESNGDFFQKIYNKFKSMGVPYGGFYLALRPDIMLVDIDVIKQVMVKDFQHFTDRGTFTDPKNDPLSGHLFSLDGQKWKALRAKLTPTFTSGKMKMMFHTLVACSDELNNILEEKERKGEPMDIKEYLGRFTTDVIGSCAFGIDCNCLKSPNTDFQKYSQLSFEPEGINIIRQIGANLIPDTFKKLRIKGIAPEVSNFFMGIVKETVKYREENNVYRKDFMQLLLQLKNEGRVQSTNLTDDELTDGEGNKTDGSIGETSTEVKPGQPGLTIEQIAAQCFVFFLAGFETSSTTMTFCLYELVKNPDIQEKVREEINTVLKKHSGKITYEAIMEMSYLEKAINETLRKYPPLPFLDRRCTKDYQLPKSKYIIRKGDNIRISVLGIHRDPEFYPNPDKFDPERFSDEEKSKRNPYTWIPFGEGPRICIGLRFGMMQTKVGLAVLLKNYKFTLNPKTQEPVKMEPKSFTMSTIGGIWLDAHKVV